MAITSRTAVRAEVAAGQSLTASLPTGYTTGDVLVALFSSSSSVATLTMTTTGWTQAIAPTDYGGSRIIAAYYQAVSGAVTAPSMTTTTAASRHAWLVQAYLGVDTATPMDATPTYAYSSIVSNPGAIVAPSITTVTANTKLISLVSEDASTATLTQPSGMTLVITSSSGVGRTAGFADLDLAATGATGTKSWGTTGTTDGAGVALALRPGASGLAAPANLASTPGSTTAALTWSAVAGATSYELLVPGL